MKRKRITRRLTQTSPAVSAEHKSLRTFTLEAALRVDALAVHTGVPVCRALVNICVVEKTRELSSAKAAKPRDQVT